MGIKRYILLLLCALQVLYVQAQHATEQSSKKGKDIQVLNNGYVLYFSSADVIAAIIYVDSKTGEDHGAAIQQLKQGLVKQMNLQTAHDDAFAVVLKKAVGTWLLYHGKGYVEKNGRQVKIIVADDAPEMKEMDGTTRKTVFFSEPDNSTAIFCGDISSEVAHK